MGGGVPTKHDGPVADPRSSMMKRKSVVSVLLLIAVLVALPAISQDKKKGKVGRRAGAGAAAGAIFGLLLGGDLGSAAEGAAVGAGVGAASGAISNSAQKKKERKAELEELQRKEAAREAEGAAAAALAADEMAQEAEAASLREIQRQATGLPQTDEEWVEEVGIDNFIALDALTYCEHDRARLLAQAAATSENFDHRLSARWVEALVELDRRNMAEAEAIYADLIPMDDDIDTVQQASLVADQLILELRSVRRDENITCDR